MSQVTLDTLLAEFKKFEIRMDSRFDRLENKLSDISTDVRAIREQTAHLTECVTRIEHSLGHSPNA